MNGSRLSKFPLRKQAAPAEDSGAYSTPFRPSRNERLRGSRIEGSPAVSYTHLDVYKRQVYLITNFMRANAHAHTHTHTHTLVRIVWLHKLYAVTIELDRETPTKGEMEKGGKGKL